jgi:TonB family protein
LNEKRRFASCQFFLLVGCAVKTPERKHLLALLLSVGLHVGAIWVLTHALGRAPAQPEPLAEPIVMIEVPAPQVPPPPPLPPPPPPETPPPPRAEPTLPAALPDLAPPPPADDRPRAYQEAPTAPTAEDWALASTYTLKNSKRYRHTWAQQVRSMMGTAFEGADQGVVRFRIEIAPNGTLVALTTLWSTSDKAEALARQAVQQMPPLPPTPNGKPLVFEKTISFQPFDADVPPIYKNDCLPDPPSYRNPFAWDGQSPRGQAQAEPEREPPLSPEEMAECQKQLPQDSVEAEAAHSDRQLKQWASEKLNRTEVPRTPP